MKFGTFAHNNSHLKTKKMTKTEQQKDFELLCIKVSVRRAIPSNEDKALMYEYLLKHHSGRLRYDLGTTIVEDMDGVLLADFCLEALTNKLLNRF